MFWCLRLTSLRALKAVPMVPHKVQAHLVYHWRVDVGGSRSFGEFNVQSTHVTNNTLQHATCGQDSRVQVCSHSIYYDTN